MCRPVSMAATTTIFRADDTRDQNTALLGVSSAHVAVFRIPPAHVAVFRIPPATQSCSRHTSHVRSLVRI
jgi:hypothetical protein